MIKISKHLKISKQLLSLCIASSLVCSCSQENHTSLNDHTTSESSKIARIATVSDPLSLDPRLVRELGSINVINTLFEGLMHIGPDQKPEFAIAKSVDISPDLLTYTFTLRDSIWSDGTPLTASDFADTWLSTLNPSFPAPNAGMLYGIKNAKAAKEGIMPLSAVGIQASSPSTLIVQLEQPLPYFLELLSTHFFLPVTPSMRNQTPNQQMSSPEKLIGNGPFKIGRWRQRDEVIVVKNPRYWNANTVALDGIAFQVLEDNTALQLFKSGKLDWTGSPIGTLSQDAISTLKETGDLKIAPAAGTHFLRFNTQKAPFDNINMRAAFNAAIDRKAIVDHITQGNQLIAMGLIPPSFGLEKQLYYKDHDKAASQKLYMAALIDLKNKSENLPEITLCYSGNDRNRKISQTLQQQWNKAFGISVKLESCENQVFYEKLRSGNYQISLGSWYADVRDPINFLEIFKTKDSPTNNTYWENTRFAELLERSAGESSPQERNQLLSEAESILLKEMPIAPLFHASFNYLINPRLEGVILLESGIINFNNASIKE